ncbi:hypothetical protein QVD17_14144 [Tagetes erecta]|uniref:Uncharacterized protein n=1 Tax=Tagetes erecta TaxID=13708 RepID=A0AAD8P2H7_TARER|nr:hypothetical protein QVD17_14144 [Tagetes erecta]
MPIHCSCLVSFSDWILLQRGNQKKVLCMECLKITSFMAKNFSNVVDPCEHPTSGILKSEIVPLFEKVLQTADIVDNIDGSIVIPKKHAEAYLPEVSDSHGRPLYVLCYNDNEEWDLHLRFGVNKMYVVDHLREYMVSNNLKRGDTCNSFIFFNFASSLTFSCLHGIYVTH